MGVEDRLFNFQMIMIPRDEHNLAKNTSLLRDHSRK